MSKTKKPRRAYQPHKAMAGGNLPLPITQQQQIETKARMAVTALRQGFYNARIGMDLIMFFAACKPAVEGSREALLLMQQAFRVINSVKDRETRTGKWGATGDELKVMDEVVPAFISLYQTFNRQDLEEGMRDALNRRNKVLLKLA